MANNDESIRVYVRSKSVPVAMRVVENQLWTTAGTFKVRRMILQYDDQLDAGQLAILEYARKLAGAAGVSLEVVDLSRMNFISRFVKSLVAKMPTVPSVVLSSAVLTGILGSQSREPVMRKLYSSNEFAFSKLLQKG